MKDLVGGGGAEHQQTDTKKGKGGGRSEYWMGGNEVT